MNQNDLEIIKGNADLTGSYAAALLVFLPVVPVVATIISIVTFVVANPAASTHLANISWFETVIPLLTGSLSTVLLWLLLAYFFRRFTSVQHANGQSFDALLNHLATLDNYIDPYLTEEEKKASLDVLRRIEPRYDAKKQSITTSPSVPAISGDSGQLNKEMSRPTSVQEALYYRNAIYVALMQRSTSWILGNGYIELWNMMNSAEEAIISFAFQDKVVSDAVDDEMRLNDSRIENSEEWTNKLRLAIEALDADAMRYLKPATGTQLVNPGEQTQQANQSGEGNLSLASDQEKGYEDRSQAQARAILRKVREAINDFNTKNWNSLITSRNQLLATMTMVGLMTYVFIEIATLIHANALHIEVATIFALIGALAGLIGRMYTEWRAETAIDDYHLSMARLLVTPLLGALAAVVGLFVVTKASSLDDIYSFKNFVTSMIIAATFGLSPNLLLNSLKKKADDYKANLQSTQATSGK